MYLTPTLDSADSAVAKIVREQGSQLHSLEEVITGNSDGSFMAEVRIREQAGGSKVAADQPENAFCKQGDVWLVTFRGETVPVTTVIGFCYLTVLLQAPGKDVHVSHLSSLGEQELLQLVGGDDLLDAQAMAAYGRAADELKERLQEAQADHDIEREQELLEQIQHIDAQLSAAQGLGSRKRELGSEVEKEAKRISTAIRRAIRRLKDAHRPLHDHLHAFVRCGQYLSYRPDTEITWVVR